MEREGGTPLLRADLLRIPQLRAGLSTIVSQYLILAGTFFVLPLYLQLVLGKNALETGREDPADLGDDDGGGDDGPATCHEDLAAQGGADRLGLSAWCRSPA